MNQTIQLIGNTPVYHLENTNIYLKLEKFNVGGSIKDRAVWGMLRHAIEQKEINSTTHLIEATSGNTGIALAMLGAALKYPVTIIMPDTMSIERRQLIQAYGATLILTDGALGMKGAITKMEEMKQENSSYYSLNQFSNPGNIAIHYETTGEEILKQIPNVDVFIAAVGTGGSFTGVSKRLKEVRKDILTIAVEPSSSAVISGQAAGKHKIQGIGAGFVPENFKREYADEIVQVSDQEAMKEMVSFSKETGILIGISSGANLAIAKKVAKQYPDKVIVTLAPDGGEKYLSMIDFNADYESI